MNKLILITLIACAMAAFAVDMSDLDEFQSETELVTPEVEGVSEGEELSDAEGEQDQEQSEVPVEDTDGHAWLKNFSTADRNNVQHCMRPRSATDYRPKCWFWECFREQRLKKPYNDPKRPTCYGCAGSCEQLMKVNTEAWTTRRHQLYLKVKETMEKCKADTSQCKRAGANCNPYKSQVVEQPSGVMCVLPKQTKYSPSGSWFHSMFDEDEDKNYNNEDEPLLDSTPEQEDGTFPVASAEVEEQDIPLEFNPELSDDEKLDLFDSATESDADAEVEDADFAKYNTATINKMWNCLRPRNNRDAMPACFGEECAAELLKQNPFQAGHCAGCLKTCKYLINRNPRLISNSNGPEEFSARQKVLINISKTSYAQCKTETDTCKQACNPMFLKPGCPTEFTNKRGEKCKVHKPSGHVDCKKVQVVHFMSAPAP